MKKIIHIVSRDKFTAAYISFFKIKMNNYEHVFITKDSGYEVNPIDNNNVYFVKEYDRIFTEKEYVMYMRQAEKVIFSGVYTPIEFFKQLLHHPMILRKFYFHFWGGDFYHVDKKLIRGRFKHNVRIIRRNLCFLLCAGLIFLIPNEYDKFVEMFGIKKRHMSAPIPFDPRNKLWYEYISPCSHPGETWILLGNSANASNCHEFGIDLLKKYAQENIKIFCPLSYSGEQDYVDKIITIGKEYFGNKFIPLTNLMGYDDYRRFLSNIDVAVFTNNRQQALGNINGLLCMGKKVYIRPDTSMWKNYENRCLKVFDVYDIERASFENFKTMNDELSNKNIENGKKEFDISVSISKWNTVLQD